MFDVIYQRGPCHLQILHELRGQRAVVASARACELLPADWVDTGGGLRREIQHLAVVQLEGVDTGPFRKQECPSPAGFGPASESVPSGLVRLFMAGAKEAGQGAVGRKRQQSSLYHK